MTVRVYILLNEQGRRYIGLSADPQLRLQQHNLGLSKWTAKYRPWRLVWLSQPLSLSDGRKLELKLKAQKGGDGLDSLLHALGS